MNRKHYIQPQVRISEMCPAQMLALSIQEGEADPTQEILVKEDNEWDIFGENDVLDFKWE